MLIFGLFRIPKAAQIDYIYSKRRECLDCFSQFHRDTTPQFDVGS